jgi:hypothetical protein
LVLNDTLKEIGTLAFAKCENLKNDLTIPDSVQSIGLNAFIDCKNLKSITWKGKTFHNQDDFNKFAGKVVWMY